MARTVPQHEWPLGPEEGCVIVTVPKRRKVPGLKHISINPKFLVLWEPKVGCEVVVIDDANTSFGFVGTVQAKDNDMFVVRFEGWDERLVGKQLAILEAIRQ